MRDRKACVPASVLRNQRILFWIGSLILITLVAVHWYAPYLIE